MQTNADTPLTVVPIGYVESRLRERSEAPRQGDEGAPDAWLVFEPAVAAGLADLRAGDEVILLPNSAGKVDLPELMLELGRREINELHVEAGSKLNASLVREGCVDELLVYLAPTLIGPGQGMFALPPLAHLADKRELRFHAVDRVGPDLRILARFEQAASQTSN